MHKKKIWKKKWPDRRAPLLVLGSTAGKFGWHWQAIIWPKSGHSIQTSPVPLPDLFKKKKKKHRFSAAMFSILLLNVSTTIVLQPSAQQPCAAIKEGSRHQDAYEIKYKRIKAFAQFGQHSGLVRNFLQQNYILLYYMYVRTWIKISSMLKTNGFQVEFLNDMENMIRNEELTAWTGVWSTRWSAIIRF